MREPRVDSVEIDVEALEARYKAMGFTGAKFSEYAGLSGAGLWYIKTNRRISRKSIAKIAAAGIHPSEYVLDWDKPKVRETAGCVVMETGEALKLREQVEKMQKALTKMSQAMAALTNKLNELIGDEQ